MCARHATVSDPEPGFATKADSLGLVLDSHSFVPYYEQIVDRVRALIKRNELREGQTFCSEGDVARTLGISKMPVRQAFQKLRSEGLLVIAKGKRPVIGSGRVPWNFQQLRGFSEEMKRRGLVPSAKVLGMALQDPELEVAQALKLTPSERVYCLKRLRFVNEEPGAAPGSPLLHIRETTYDAQQTPIEYSVSLLRGDRYSASVVSIRKK